MLAAFAAFSGLVLTAGTAGSVRRGDAASPTTAPAAVPDPFPAESGENPAEAPGVRPDAAASAPGATGATPAARRRFAPGAAVSPLRVRPGRNLAASAAGHSPAKPARELILTFDDGPDLETTPVVLTELRRRGLRAVFFVNGEHMVGSRPDDFARRDLVRRMATEGHLVANHTLAHRNVCADPEGMDEQIDGNAEIIAGATGLRPLLFRSPYGARCRRLEQALAERELLSVGWNLDPQEWKGGSEAAIVDYVTKRLARFTGRAVLLLHDTRAEAVAALPRILDWVVAENARAQRAGQAPIAIADYSVFLPTEPLPDSGLGAFAVRLQNATGGLAAVLAGARAGR